MGYIYRIINKINGKSYIGETKQKDVNSRWQNHIKSIKTNDGATALIGAFNKYGLENFKFEVIIICFDEDRLLYEVEYIRKYNTLVPNGYNIVEGRINTSTFNSNTFNEYLREKKDHATTIHNKMKSYNISIQEKMKNSERWIKALAEKRVGNGNNRNQTDDTKKKISESLKIYYSNSNIEKYRQAMTKAAGKSIEQYSLNNEFIKKYESIRSAARELNISKGNIQKNLYGKSKQAAGFIWKYVT